MTLVGMNVNGKMIHVNVEDLNAAEREQVQETIGLINEIKGRSGLACIAGIIATLIAFIGILALRSSFSITGGIGIAEHLFQALLAMLFGMVIMVIAIPIAKKINQKSIEKLHVLSGLNIRCKEILDAYIEVCPEFGKVMRRVNHAACR